MFQQQALMLWAFGLKIISSNCFFQDLKRVWSKTMHHMNPPLTIIDYLVHQGHLHFHNRKGVHWCHVSTSIAPLLQLPPWIFLQLWASKWLPRSWIWDQPAVLVVFLLRKIQASGKSDNIKTQCSKSFTRLSQSMYYDSDNKTDECAAWSPTCSCSIIAFAHITI